MGFILKFVLQSKLKLKRKISLLINLCWKICIDSYIYNICINHKIINEPVSYYKKLIIKINDNVHVDDIKKRFESKY